jgi:hypothetical protein
MPPPDLLREQIAERDGRQRNRKQHRRHAPGAGLVERLL